MVGRFVGGAVGAAAAEVVAAGREGGKGAGGRGLGGELGGGGQGGRLSLSEAGWRRGRVGHGGVGEGEVVSGR